MFFGHFFGEKNFYLMRPGIVEFLNLVAKNYYFTTHHFYATISMPYLMRTGIVEFLNPVAKNYYFTTHHFYATISKHYLMRPGIVEFLKPVAKPSCGQSASADTTCWKF